MKTILAIPFVILSLTTSSSFALEIYKGKLINHKEWTTGNNVKSNFKVTLNNRVMSNRVSDYALLSTTSYAMPVKGTVDSPIVLSGNNTVYIYNSSSEAQTYNYTFHICGYVSDHEAQCSYFFDTIHLEPKGYLANSLSPELQLEINKPGNYNFDTGVNVSSGDDLSIRLMGSSHSTNVFNVTER